MKVLIIGGGGREHALAWKAARSPDVSTVFVAPGNAGTAAEAGVENIPIASGDIPALLDFAREQAVDLTIVGPEAPLVAGIVDDFQEAGLVCFGPGRSAARLEGSKSFAKAFLRRHHIPTADYAHFSDLEAAVAYIKEKGAPIVIKADGLAAGKGVTVAGDVQEAIAAVEDMLAGNRFGAAGSSVVIEEFLQGEEASFIVVCDGHSTLPLATTQDHKRRDDGDRGPNTGGMGAYSPAPVIDQHMHERIMKEIIIPVVRGMRAEGMPYVGFLYAGIMITPEGTPRVLEFNCRFGDPETQPVMLRLKSDLVELCRKTLEGDIENFNIQWDERSSLGVVLASAGYPDSASSGDIIEGVEGLDDDTTKVFHAGTALDNDRMVTAGGRVMCITALGESVRSARENAYRAISNIRYNGMFYRQDIGYRAVERDKKGN